MTVFTCSLSLLAATLLLHLAWWRVRLPRRQTPALLACFAAVYAAGGLLLAASGAVGAGGLFQIGLFAAAFAPAYVITYSAIEADSPSLLMVLEIRRAGKAGLPEGVLFAQLDDAVLIHPRLADLLRDRMAVLEEGRYRLTGKGRWMARLFAAQRRVLGRGLGG